MVKILRKNYCVIVYNESENRGIAFPKRTKVEVGDFIAELKEIAEKAEEIKAGIIIVPLLFDSDYPDNFEPMSKFLKGKKGPKVLSNNNMVRKLYKFYFTRAIPQISPGGIDYIFLG